MIKRFLLPLLCIFCSCTNTPNNIKSDTESSQSMIPTLRKNPNPKPVASYIIPMGDPKLDRKFGVEVFETPFTFKYLLSMQYDGTLETDTLRLPELNTWPEVIVKPGPGKLSCIIGFLDDKKQFMEYKMLSEKNKQLSLKVIKSYAVYESTN